MEPPFTQQVATDEWRRAAVDWVHIALQGAGLEPTGELTHQRTRPWSTINTIETNAGQVWFKANCPSMAYEPALHLAISQIVPEHLVPPLAIDRNRGWMLTVDQGPTLANKREPTRADWLRLIEDMTQMQAELANHRRRMLATGMPDCRPETVVERFGDLVDRMARLPVTHPSHLDNGDVSQLMAMSSQLQEAADLLAMSGVGSSWHHGDLHLDNVTERDGRLWIFDLGDSQWAHRMELLVVPFSVLMDTQPAWWRWVREAACDGWGLNPDDFHDLWRAVTLTQPVGRAFTWLGALENASRKDERTWGENAKLHLMRVRNV